MSVSKGYGAALDYAQDVGCECIQLFAKSPRQWKGAALDSDAAQAFVADRAARGFGPVFTHTAYLINLTTDDPIMREKSVVALADELRRGAALGVDGVVTHLGTDPKADPVVAAVRCGKAITEAYELAAVSPDRARLLLENTAGAGSTFGGSVRELASVIAATELPPEVIGICFDTCHGFAFGDDLSTSVGWVELVSEMREVLGLDRVGLIHANDCMFDRGSHRDRHAWIGDGSIGTEGFRAMICEPDLAQVPVVTEMPGEVPEKDATNIARLKALRVACS